MAKTRKTMTSPVLFASRILLSHSYRHLHQRLPVVCTVVENILLCPSRYKEERQSQKMCNSPFSMAVEANFMKDYPHYLLLKSWNERVEKSR